LDSLKIMDKDALGLDAHKRTSFLDRELWLAMGQAESREDFCSAWLHLQCRMGRDISCATVVLKDEDGDAFSSVAVWPAPHGTTKLLQQVAEAALEQRRGVVLHSDEEEGVVGIALPIVLQGELQGAVALEVAEQSDGDVELFMRLLQWGVGWHEAFFLRNEKREVSQQKGALQALDFAAAALEKKTYVDAASSIVTELAILMQCDRISIGMFSKEKSKMLTISNHAEFEKKMQLVRGIEAMMDESAVQHAVIYYPSEDESSIHQVHDRFAKEYHMGAVLSVPLPIDTEIWGVMTLERDRDEPFNDADMTFCDALAALLGPIFELKYRNNRMLPLKIVDSAVEQCHRLVGPKYLIRKFVAVFIVAVVLFFSFAMGMFQVNAESSIEGAVRRVISSPEDGYIMKSYFRAGDRVKQGDVLVLLDDRDLQLEKAKWIGKLGEIRNQYKSALAKHEKVDIRIGQAKIKQAEAQLELMRMKLSKTVVRTPFDGLVVSGDLSQSLGVAKEKGDELFQIAPLNAYRVVMQVSEQDISHIMVGQRGSLRLSALPDKTFEFNVKKITPVTHVFEGGNFFRVEASLQQPLDYLRPGMKGVGKIEIGKQRLWWIWTHNLVDWMRLKLWSWLL